MPDISVIWDVDNSRGDWSFEPFAIAGQQINITPAVQFGIGDGSSTRFSLAQVPAAISAIISASIYRNDWQGNQLLYATPRTNLLTQSQSFDNVAWTKAASSITPNVKTAPDGTVTMDKLVEDSTNSQHYVSRLDQSILPNTTYSASVFAAAAERRYLCVGYRTGGSWVGGQPSATFDLVNGVVNFVGSGATASIQNLGGGIYKCTVSAVSGSSGFSSGPFYQLLAAGGTLGVSYLGDGASGAYVWGGQSEVGSASTSYIATTTAAVTVTDYSLTLTGSVVLAVAPVLSAVLSWTGSYVSNTYSGGDLATGNDLQTAVLVSLFTDRRANPDDVIPDGTGDPRGWWGDIGEDTPIGSRLWLLDRSKQTQEVLNNARDYIVEALQWLVDDGVVASIDVQTEWTRDTFLGAQIILYQPTGPQIPLTYAWAWNQLS